VTIYHFLEVRGVPWVLQASVLAGALLLVWGLLVRRRLAATEGGMLPDEGLSLRNVFEMLVELLVNMAKSTMGDQWRRYFPVVGTMFFFILLSNLIGLIPGLGGATSSATTTWTWGFVSFCLFIYVGIRTHGFWYINHFLGPSLMEAHLFGRKIHVRPLFFIFLPLELIQHLARIMTLAIRLFANMFADHTVVGVWLKLVPIVVPAIFMGLGLLVAFLQAYVFALLSMIYVGLALEEAH
jgi:F-type H+-transporting ATPase subunit a